MFWLQENLILMKEMFKKSRNVQLIRGSFLKNPYFRKPSWNYLFRAPTDCLQYLTGVSNSFTSFNFGNLMIRNLQYDVCIRPERGYCRFQLQESSSVIASFVLDPAPATAAATVKSRDEFELEFSGSSEPELWRFRAEPSRAGALRFSSWNRAENFKP